jgi:phage tail sheath protein FI
MVQVSYPGVYILEVPSGVHTITGVSTSIAAFFGRTNKGALNKPTRILSLADFERAFGRPHPQSDLADSVTQFFTNGGTDCYVVRLANGATRAAVTLRNLNNLDVLVATAKAEGIWANTVRLVVDYNTVNPTESFNLTVLQEENGAVVASESFTGLVMDPLSPRYAPTFVSQTSDLIDLALADALLAPAAGPLPTAGSFINNLANSFAGYSLAMRPLGAGGAAVRDTLNGLITPAAPTAPKSSFEISVNNSPWVLVDLAGIAPLANTLPAIRTAIRNTINTAVGAVSPGTTVEVEFTNVANVGNLMTITANNGPQHSVRIRRASSNDLAAALMAGVEQGGIEATRFGNFRPAPSATVMTLGPVVTAGSVTGLQDLAGRLQTDINAITVDGRLVALPGLETVPGGARWFQNAAGASPNTGDNDGLREKLRLVAAAINGVVDLPYRAEVWGYHLAILAKAATSGGTPTSPNAMPAAALVTAPNDIGATFVRNTRQYTLGTGGTSPFSTNGIAGNDGAAPTAADYLGNKAAQTGLYALDPVDLFNLMILPGDAEVTEAVMAQVWGPASVYCASRRAFLIVDAPASWTDDGRAEVVNDTALINDLRATVVKDYSAVFYPRLRYSSAGVLRHIGPAGAIAGLMARIDSTRGVWKAPAGIEADIRGVLGLEANLADMENGVLNKQGVNALRVFPSGIVNWGARTLAGQDDIGSEWKYIPIRRLALFLEESLYRGTKWVVFEPNDEPLWARIRQNINAFMMGLFRQGAFQGTTPDKAFFVKCDAETTTQADRNLGIVNILIGFAPLKPAEFVIIRIQQIAGDL